jgi:hypothetical protein
MASDPNSAVGQAENANELLAGYFADMNKFVSDITGTEIPPDVSEIVSKLDFSELHRMATTRASDSSSFENGAAIENIHMMAAITREFNLRSKSKIDYYADGSSDYMNESNFYSTMKSFWTSMIIGLHEEGKTS